MERISFAEIPQEMMRKLMDLENYINKSGLDIKLLELLRLRVAQVNGCAYCIDMHYKELKHTGETDLRLASLMVWEETTYFTDKERAVLHFAEKVTVLNGRPMADKDYAVIKDHFNNDEVVVLTLAVAQINTWTRLMKTFQIEAGNYAVSQ